MSHESTVEELLLHWAEQRAAGREVGAEELGAHHPDLIDELRRRIVALRAVQCVVDTAPAQIREGESVGPTPSPQVPGYEVLGELGRGGMGVVYRARHVALGRTVALKVLLSGAFAGESERTRFRREAEVVARLNHPNVVQIYEVGEHTGCPFLALELMEGGSLADRLGGASQEPGWAAEMVEVLAQALAHAHGRGVLHRDLKPGNVLLTGDGTPKLSDFGLARKLDSASPGRPSGEQLTDTGAVLGTPAYMAPEQAAGRTAEVGPAADVWALGAVLYELLTGRPPFQAATPIDIVLQVLERDPAPLRSINARVPRDLEIICLKCLQKEPARRYASALDLAEDLRRFRAGEAIRARPVSRTERAWRWCRRRPLAVGLLAALGLALLAGGTVLILLRSMHARDKASAQAEFDRGIALIRLNETAEAEAALAEAVRLDPTHAAARAYHAWTFIARRDYDKGLVECEEALRLDPRNYDALRFRAGIHTEQGRHEEAVRDTTEILRLGGDPHTHGPYVIRCHAYVILGQWDRAADDFDLVCEHLRAPCPCRWPKPCLGPCFSSRLSARAGDSEGYRRACADLLQRFGKTADTDSETAYLLARVFALAPDCGIAPARTVQLAEQALRGKVTAWYEHALGLAHLRAGQSTLGIQRLHESIASSVITWDGSAVNQLALALLHHQQGDTDAARSWLEMATRQPPRVIHPHETMAYQILRREAETAIRDSRK